MKSDHDYDADFTQPKIPKEPPHIDDLELDEVELKSIMEMDDHPIYWQ